MLEHFAGGEFLYEAKEKPLHPNSDDEGDGALRDIIGHICIII